jgi:hypothetical protein
MPIYDDRKERTMCAHREKMWTSSGLVESAYLGEDSEQRDDED